MSEKDTVTSQDIPALIRALGTLALAAATAVAIKWFFSHDNKEEKTECTEADLQNSLCSTVQDEKTTYDGCIILDGVPQNTNPPKVSDGGEKTINLLLEGCYGSDYYRSPAEISCISQSTNSEQENGEQINISCGISPQTVNQITLVACKLNEVATSPANSAFFVQREDGCNASVPTSTTRGSATSAATTQMISGCLTQRCDSLSSIQEPECSFRTSSNYGECIDDFNTRCSGCQYKLSDQDNPVAEPECSFGTSSNHGECIDDFKTRCSGCQYKLSDQANPVAEPFAQHNTVSIGVSGDTVTNKSNEKDGFSNCHSETNDIKYTTSPEKQKHNVDNLVIDFNDEDNTSVSSIGIGGRKKVEIICNPSASKIEMRTRIDACLPNCHYVPLISDDTAKFEVNSAVENDTLPCTEVFSRVQKTLSACENIVSAADVCKDIKQNVTLHSRTDSQGTNIYQSNGGHKCTLTDDIVTEIPNGKLKHCIQDTVQNTNDVDNDTENMVPSLENVLPKKDSKNDQQFLTSMDADPGRYEALESFQGSSHCDAIIPEQETKIANTHFYPNNTNELPLSENWKATTLYNYTDQTALMCSLDLADVDASFNIEAKQNEHQIYAEETPVAFMNKRISKDVSQSPIFEKFHENIDIGKESFGLYSANSNAEHAMTTFENIMNYSTSLVTGGSTGVTGAEFISGVNPISYVKDNTEFQNWHTCTAEHQESSNVFTNGYLDINHDENNSISNIIKKQGVLCSKDLTSILSEPCSSLLNTVFPNDDSSLENTHFCKHSNVTLPAMMDIDNTAHKGQHNANESDFFQENVNICREEQLPGVGDTFSSCTTPLAKAKQNDPMCCDSNLSSTQDQNTCLTFNVTNLSSEDRDDVSHSREKIMSAIAENPALILPEYQSKCRLVKKRPLITKSCDNILSGHSYQEPTLKSKAQSMLCLLTEYYSSKVLSEKGPVEEVARGSFIRIPKGLQSIGEVMRFQLTLGNCLELLKLARKNRVQELLKAVYSVISDNYLNVLKNSAVYGQLTGLERERILQLRMRGQLSLCVVETKSIFGLNKYIRCPVETTEHKAQLYMLDIETNQWRPVTSIPEEACLKGCSICSMHNYLFIAGGLQETTEGLTCSNKLFCYNPLTDIWTKLSSMNEGRSQLKLIPLDGYLYAIGGECLHTVERYDPRSNKWIFVAPLPKGTFAVAHEAAACGGEIYISGGHLFYRLLKYSPVHDEWEECPFNTSKGRSCDMVAVGSILYRFDMHKDSSVNILKYNTMAKMWSEYTETFPGSKIPFKCALLEGNIYCLNRETTAKFSMNDEKVVFEAGVFSNVPTKGPGSPHPAVLCLRGSVSQTSV